jgi:preprotein translocase subunit SecE
MATTNKPTTADKKPRQSEPNQPVGQSFGAYLQGVRAEWHKISWPTWPQIWGQTIVVLVMVSVMTLGLFVLDNSVSQLIKLMTPHRS